MKTARTTWQAVSGVSASPVTGLGRADGFWRKACREAGSPPGAALRRGRVWPRRRGGPTPSPPITTASQANGVLQAGFILCTPVCARPCLHSKHARARGPGVPREGVRPAKCKWVSLPDASSWEHGDLPAPPHQLGPEWCRAPCPHAPSGDSTGSARGSGQTLPPAEAQHHRAGRALCGRAASLRTGEEALRRRAAGGRSGRKAGQGNEVKVRGGSRGRGCADLHTAGVTRVGGSGQGPGSLRRRRRRASPSGSSRRPASGLGAGPPPPAGRGVGPREVAVGRFREGQSPPWSPML